MARLTPSQRRKQRDEAATLRVQMRQSQPVPMKPPAGYGAEPWVEPPAYEERVIQNPAFASLGPISDLLVMQWAARQPGVKPGTGLEADVLAEMDARREEALAEERNRKHGTPRGARFSTGRIVDGRYVSWWALPGRRGLVEVTS
jgi:hypothetical protein